MTVAFNRPTVTGKELDYIREALDSAHVAGNGAFTRRCNDWLAARTGAKRAFLTHSGTAALEMAALLCGIGPGDEVVMPSFTFVSTANAVALRGATPVFVDIRPDTLNIDETAIEAALTTRTKAICVVHYAGIACAMDAIAPLARRRGVRLIEDAAQALCSSYRGRPLGGFGDFAAVSFHETKNFISGEGGALLVNDSGAVARAETIWEKGTDRGRFFRGEVDKYTWQDLGSSFLPSDMIAAFLWAQLEQAAALLTRRAALWHRYHDGFAALETRGAVRRPVVPAGCEHNAHLYYLLLPDRAARDRLLNGLRAAGIQAPFHYVPLHSSPAGRKFGRSVGELAVTDDIAGRLLRMPLWHDMKDEPDRVIDMVYALL
ncbi:MAG TPA: dTDP-4-amino-4,6-dideoxygalactose transaminase [Stellaceae bacterium]|nr:dTDP-4-amino-4,6-dideoxygalactose transaminase [Stellaceae bacterium]